MNLDMYQKRAAFQDYPHSIIIAGAGTGKTYTLLGRIQYLINKQGLKPEEILVISYTNETVRDFQSKILEKLGIQITVLTFHKLAMYLLEHLSLSYTLVSDSVLDYIAQELIQGYAMNQSSLQHYLLRSISFWQSLRVCNYHALKNDKQMQHLSKELIQFIHLFRAKGFLTDGLSKIYHKCYGKNKAKITLIYILCQLYESEKTSQVMLDFDDLIQVATENIKNISSIPFKHILVDEFQDSSLIRIEFFQKLVEQFQLDFTVVGDDCQSIYRFSGTETNCFSLLTQKFLDIHYFYLKYTYRNSQELIDIANHFILKNPNQIKKEILSSKHLKYPVEILYYRNRSSIFEMLRYIFTFETNSVLFLGRNSFDWKYYFLESDIHWIDKKHFSLKQFPNKEFTFLTVHQSKGLEADLVILLHVEDSIYGFPNKVSQPSYFSYITPKDNIVFEEERRLFYVALTRTKNKIFLIVPFSKPSVFVKELLREQKKKMKVSFF